MVLPSFNDAHIWVDDEGSIQATVASKAGKVSTFSCIVVRGLTDRLSYWRVL